MGVVGIDTAKRSQVRQFLELPFRLYRDVPQWVPPLAGDVELMLDRRRHPFYRHSEAAFFLALEGDRARGRLAVLENRNYNAFNGTRTAFFCLFECEDSVPTALALFEAAAAWARARGLDLIRGPRGMTALDGLGLLVRGFEHRPALGIAYNPPYYPALIEAAGFLAEPDIVSGYLSAAAPFPERIHQLAELVKRRRGLKVARYRTRRDLRALVPRLGKMYNDSLAGTADNVPLTPAELDTVAGQLLSYADPRLIKIVMKDDEPVGYLFAYPDVSAALQRTSGRLFPLGWADILLEIRRTRWVNINGAGIVQKYRGLGGTALLFSEMHKSIVEGGFEHAELVQIGTDNDDMQRELRSLGVDFYKAHRLYCREPG